MNVATPPADLVVDHFAVLPLADWEVGHFSDSQPADLPAVQVYSQGMDSQEVVSGPGPMRLPASKTRRKTELPVRSSA
jgi:hypothetical protein